MNNIVAYLDPITYRLSNKNRKDAYEYDPNTKCVYQIQVVDYGTNDLLNFCNIFDGKSVVLKSATPVQYHI